MVLAVVVVGAVVVLKTVEVVAGDVVVVGGGAGVVVVLMVVDGGRVNFAVACVVTLVVSVEGALEVVMSEKEELRVNICFNYFTGSTKIKTAQGC